jgi:lysophospholipase L1-like esterase
MLHSRRTFMGAIAAPLLAQDTKLVWRNARELTIEGQGWTDTKSPYDRLPAKAEALVRPEVWNLSRHGSGIQVRFRTNAKAIHAKWSVGNQALAMPNTVGIAHSGLDLYVRHDAGKLRWVGFGAPEKFPESTRALVSGMAEAWRDYTLYLPLFNSVQSLEIGVPEGSQIEAAAKRTALPIVFYGTSITHAAGASRAGMSHVSILGRRFDRPVINLGFSGNGRMEIEVARLLTELEAAVYVIDCLPNIVAAQVTERTEPLVKELRRVRPDTPILLVEDRTYQNAFLVEALMKRNLESRAAFKAAYASLKKEGVKGLHYLEGDDLLGDDGEGTIDASHPTDLGYVRQADAFEKPLRKILKSVKK